MYEVNLADPTDLSFSAADVLLWKHKPLSGGVLAGATIGWILFEWSGYTLLSLVSNVLLFLIVIFFLWSNAAGLLNRYVWTGTPRLGLVLWNRCVRFHEGA